MTSCSMLLACCDDAIPRESRIVFALKTRCGFSTAEICRKAGLPVRHWHTLRHAFGTHAALFGVNPWRL